MLHRSRGGGGGASPQRHRRLWGSLSALRMSSVSGHRKYKKLRVFFEGGQHVSWPQSSTCEYGEAVTIGQLAESLAEKHVCVSPKLARHFALMLVDVKGMSPSTAIKWSTAASDVEQQLESLNSELIPGVWQLRLRMLVPPQSASELRETDPAAFEYYFAQIVNDFISHSHAKIGSEDVLHLGTILVRHCLLSGDFHAGHITSDLVHSLSQEIGLSKFFPARFLVHHNRSGNLSSRILNAMNRFCSEQDTPAQCQTRFLEVLGAVDPALGLNVFRCEGGPAAATTTAPAAGAESEQRAGELVVDPVDGLLFEHEGGGKRVTICSFHDVLALRSKERDVTLKFSAADGSTRAWELCAPSPALAETVVVVVDQHKRVLAGGDGYRAFSRRSAAHPTPMPKRSASEPAEGDDVIADDGGLDAAALDAAAAAKGGEGAAEEGETAETASKARKSSAASSTRRSVSEDVAGARAAGEEAGASGSSTVAVARESDVEEDDDPSTYMALSESARGSLYEEDAERESWEIPIKQLRITQVLGKGEFGEVQRGVWRYSSRQMYDVAIKTVKPKPGFEEQQEEFLQELMDEAALMMRLDHACIVTMYGVARQDDGSPMIVMELMPLGELKDYVMLHKDSLKGTTLAMQYCCQIARACEYLHSLDIIHRDLAARNVLIKEPKTVKVADFGLSRYCEDVYMIRGTKKMPLKWMAPECINFRRHTKKSDVWMFGVTCWEIMSYGKKPFQTMAVKKYIAEIQRGVRLQKPLGCPQPLYAVLLSCWKYDSVDRSDFAKIVGQLTAVIGMFPNRPISDEVWARLGGGPRDKETSEPAAPIRPKVKHPRPQRQRSSGGGGATNPFDDDDGGEGDSSEPPSGLVSPAEPLSGAEDHATPPREGSPGVNGSAVVAAVASASSPSSVSSAATGAAGAAGAKAASAAGGGNGVATPAARGAISAEIAAELGLIIEPPAADNEPPPETDEERAERRKARRAARLAEKLRLARASILDETGVDPGELDFLALNGGLKKAPPPVASKPKKPSKSSSSAPPPVAAKPSKGKAAPRTDVAVFDVEAAFDEAEAEDDDSPESANDYSIDLDPDARSRDRRMCFGDSIRWTIFAPKPLANTVDRKDAFSIRCARIVQDHVRLKELGENPDPKDYIPMVLRLCTSFEGMIIETRTYLAREARDLSRRARVQKLAKGLGPRLQDFLESAADAVINHGDASHAILWQDALKGASMLTVGCVGLCEAAMAARTGSYAMFKPKKIDE